MASLTPKMSFRGVGNLQEPFYCYSWIEKTQKVQYNKGYIQGSLDNTFSDKIINFLQLPNQGSMLPNFRFLVTLHSF